MPDTYAEKSRRSYSHDRSRLPGWLKREIKPREILFAIAALVVALGWTIQSPSRRMTAIEERQTHTESRVDTLTKALEFTNYLQCVQLRRTDATMLPPGCAPILEKSGHP